MDSDEKYSVQFYDREKLYNEIWQEPATKVAKRYGVSDVALAKTCKKLHVPKPPPGYWSKKEFGKAPTPPKLPNFDDAPRVQIGRARAKELDEPEAEYLAPEAFKKARILVERERTDSCKIEVSKECSRWHRYVRNTRQYFKSIKKSQWSYGPMYGRYCSHGEDTFRARISPQRLDRASLILQALCDAFTARQFPLVTHKGHDENHTFLGVEIMGETILFEFFERSVKQKKPEGDKRYGDYIYVPTGVLSIKICSAPYDMKSKKRWADTKKSPLEEKLNEIVIGLILAAAWEKERAEYFRIQKLRWKKEQEKRAEEEHLRKIEVRRVELLHQGAADLKFHQELCHYVRDNRDRYLSEYGDIEQDSEFDQWLKWAQNYLDESDPLKGGYPRYNIED